MKRLKKFVELGSSSEGSARTAYALDRGSLPTPGRGLRWKQVTAFQSNDELIENAGLIEVFQSAITNGCAVVRRETRG
jgi:hypothetical protein